jgi:hypothetical protein
MSLAKLAIELREGPGPPGLDVGEPPTDRAEGLLSLRLGLILEIPGDEGLIEREAVRPVREPGVQELAKGPRVIGSVCGHA